jgi:hypothetical protein
MSSRNLDFPPELLARVGTYATRKGLDNRAAVLALLDSGLRAYEQRVAAGAARGAAVTSDEARAAALAAWTTKRKRARAAKRTTKDDTRTTP